MHVCRSGVGPGTGGCCGAGMALQKTGPVRKGPSQVTFPSGIVTGCNLTHSGLVCIALIAIGWDQLAHHMTSLYGSLSRISENVHSLASSNWLSWRCAMGLLIGPCNVIPDAHMDYKGFLSLSHSRHKHVWTDKPQSWHFGRQWLHQNQDIHLLQQY